MLIMQSRYWSSNKKQRSFRVQVRISELPLEFEQEAKKLQSSGTYI